MEEPPPVAKLNVLCPCGSSKPYITCCATLREGHEHAPTAEELMRSRYAAYVLLLEDYCDRPGIPPHAYIISWRRSTDQMARPRSEAPTNNRMPNHAIVEFVARYQGEWAARTGCMKSSASCVKLGVGSMWDGDM